MSLRKCPVCDVSVKIENLERHMASVHPRQRSAVNLTDEERRAISQTGERTRAPLRIPRSTAIAAAVVSLAILGLVVALPYLPGVPSGGMAIHWHPTLKITIDGQTVEVPANIGIDPLLWKYHDLDTYGMQGMAPLHTHDASGTIHVESREARTYTLGDFLRIWGQTFDAQQVLGHSAGPGHQVWMVVDGSRVSPSYSQVLRDGMQIAVVCGIPG